MPAYGVSTKATNEGRAQLLVGAIIVVSFVALYFAKNLASALTPFGLQLGDVANLAFDALWLALIIWAIVSPPVSNNAWLSATYVMIFPSMHLLMNRQAHPPLVVVMCDILVVVAGTVGGLSIIARRLWGAK